MFAPAGLEPGQGVGLKNNETQFNLVKRHQVKSVNFSFRKWYWDRYLTHKWY